MIDNPERGILADREALRRVDAALVTARHPDVRSALTADREYLTGLIATHEAAFAAAHGI